MRIAIVLFLVVDLAVLVVVAMQFKRMRRHNAELAAAVAATTAKAARPLATEPVFAEMKERRITIEILNPIELAATQSRFSGIAGAVAPDLLRKVVYDRAAAIVREQFVEQGVKADVKVQVGA
ncbi:hypothetical protein ACHIPZ_23375 [Antrihabitans sp. NCIMB 15449]|uniref:Flp pilus-assembly TadG-like N-terminal domain-containing protein n=1 Tax=Antrihabitans spumae TaxID=3373370 RepID=A0ABW7JVU9_9NOCA